MSDLTPFLSVKYLYLQLYNLLTSEGSWSLLILLSFILKVFLIVVTPFLIYGVIRRSRELKKLYEDYQVEPPTAPERRIEYLPPKNTEWEHIQKLMASDNASDWKLAIIEADKMLDDLTKVMQYSGDTIGERLQAVEPSDFTTLNQAWEAHKVRNRIAHEPGFVLTERLARQTMANYQAVFEEFERI